MMAFIKKYWIFIGIACMGLLAVIMVLLSTVGRSARTVPPAQTGQNATPAPAEPTPQTAVSYTPEMKAAIDEAKQASTTYDSNVAKIRNDYPWLRKLPYTNGTFYVYFDLETHKFIGKIYPKKTDDVEAMKRTIISDLKVLKEIPADSFPFEWIVAPAT